MRRCNDSVISPFFVFFVKFVMIFNVVSSYKTTWHYDKNAVIKQDSDSNEIEMNSSIFISRLLKTSPSIKRFTEEHRNAFDELSQFAHATFQEHTSKPYLRYHPPTSCGHITCDFVPGYPEDIIIEVVKSINLIPDSPKLESLPKRNFPVVRSLDHRHSKHHVHSPERVQDCSKLVHEIVKHPKESINEKDQAKLLVNLPEYYFGLTVKECRGPKACRDAHTPEHKVYGCVPDFIIKTVEIFIPETQTMGKQNIRIPNGCICGLYDE